MWTPKNISEWLDERIEFCDNFLSLNKNNENNLMVSNFIVGSANFKYCKKLYLELLSDSENIELIKLFKNISYKLIFDTIYELDKSEYRCMYIGDYCFPTKEKEVLPQELIDNFTKHRKAMEVIFNEVNQLCNINLKTI